MENNRLFTILSQITACLAGTLSLSQFTVSNQHGSIGLDESLQSIIKKLRLIYLKPFIKNLTERDIILFKLQLWFEESLVSLQVNTLHNVSYNKIIKLLTTKYEHQARAKSFKVGNILSTHVINIKSAIVIAITILSSLKKSNEPMLLTDFVIKVANAYIYRNIFFTSGDYLTMSYLDFLTIQDISNNDLYRYGYFIYLPFELLGLSQSINIKEEVSGHTIFLKDELTAVLLGLQFCDNVAVPMISKPLNWLLHNKVYVGGVYRYDLTKVLFIHTKDSNDHKLTNVQFIVDNINVMQSRPLHISKGLLDYLYGTDLVGDKFNQDILDVAKAYGDLTFYIPMYIDWRTRVYTGSKLLSYGNLSKALIQMECNTPTTDEGLRGFKIFTAMAYGKGSQSNNEKVLWFDTYMSSTIDASLVKTSKDLYDFINLSLAYSDYLVSGILKVNLRFDATCSGIQHISGLLEDAELGKGVNLGVSNDSKSPEDLYSDVLPYVIEELKDYTTSRILYIILGGY